MCHVYPMLVNCHNDVIVYLVYIFKLLCIYIYATGVEELIRHSHIKYKCKDWDCLICKMKGRIASLKNLMPGVRNPLQRVTSFQNKKLIHMICSVQEIVQQNLLLLM